MLHPTRDGRSPGDASFYSGKSRERGRSEVSDAPGTQAVEGMNILLEVDGGVCLDTDC